MLSLHNIWTVARFEIKTLLRSWFFRIFAGLAVVGLFVLNLLLLTNVGNSPWIFRGLPASVPYLNLSLLNVVQAVIAVFLASDFLKRDKKLDTTEVVYMRSMTNGDYVFGKTLGIFLVFLGLNLAVLLVAGIFHAAFSDLPFGIKPYLYYPLLISLPTLFYVFGLAFLLMSLIRNQAVTFVVLLGYIGLTLFVLGGKVHHLFDYMSFNVPLMYSDFVGFGDVGKILIHRGIYFCLGVSFIGATVLLLRRLPQSVAMTRTAIALTVAFFVAALALGYTHLRSFYEVRAERKEMLGLNTSLATLPRPTLVDMRLTLEHRADQLHGVADMTLRNQTDQPLARFVLALNPGLTVDRVEQAGQPAEVRRRRHLLEVTLPRPLAAGAEDSLRLVYHGKIDESVCYLDVDQAARESSYRLALFNIDKRHAFLTKNFGLLTPEALWYPKPGVTYTPQEPAAVAEDFCRFQLEVNTAPGLEVIAQGEGNQVAPGRFLFRPEVPLPRLSLAIGPYERRALVVDSVQYALYTLPRHDYFVPYFNEVGDTLAALIREIRQDYEVRVDLKYPYRRLLLVEVPVQFYAYTRVWGGPQETVQPQMIFLPEKGVVLPAADFREAMRRERWRAQRTNQISTPKETQTRLFRQFVGSTLVSGMTMIRIGRGGDPLSGAGYNVFPNFYSFATAVRSHQWPFLNLAMEAFLRSRAEATFAPPFRFFSGLTQEEKVNQALQGKSLRELLSDEDAKALVADAIKLKGTFLFTYLQHRIGKERFAEFVREWIDRARFQAVDPQQFVDELRSRFGVDLTTLLTEWSTSTQLPGYVFSELEGYKVLDGERTRYQVRFKVTNAEPVAGLLVLTFRVAGGGPGFGFGPPGFGQANEVQRTVALGPGETKEIGIVLDDQPRMVTINTLTSRNLPSVLSKPFDEFQENKKAQPFDGERLVSEPVSLVGPGELVVDNEEPGCRVTGTGRGSPLRRLLGAGRAADQERYVAMQFWRLPSEWKTTVQANFFGRYVRSAYFTKPGGGDKSVTWTTPLDAPGYYGVYYYIGGQMPGLMRFGRGPGGPGPRPGERPRESGQYHFRIHHDDGVDEVLFDRASAEEGWNFLGRYYLSGDSAKVELTNKSDARVVFADAVKWVKE
ncbi:MAG: hypothetical protein ONB30_11290 [candidate division KSB1 bacterium]|nr:hypothetical protein [candidate division KSB1 bacterium]